MDCDVVVLDDYMLVLGNLGHIDRIASTCMVELVADLGHIG